MNQIKEGDRVEITQAIMRRGEPLETTIAGTIVGMMRRPTGSWFAQGKHGRLWLGRLDIRKDDGEITRVVVDPHTQIHIVPK